MKKVALVTGASSGLGREFVKHLDKERDLEFWLVARSKDSLDKLASSLKNTSKVLDLDLTNKSDLDSFKSKVSEEKPQISFLINCAGIGKIGEFSHLSIEEQVYEVELNVNSVLEITYAALPYVTNGGIIINIASVASFLPQPEFAVYAATKAFVRSWSVALSKEKSLRDRGITVTTVYPNPMKTSFFNVAASTKEQGDTIQSIGTEDPSKVAYKALEKAKKGKSHSISSINVYLINLCYRLFPVDFALWVERKFMRLFS